MNIGFNIVHFIVLFILLLFDITEWSQTFIFKINIIGSPCFRKCSCIWKETCVVVAGQSCLISKVCLDRLILLCFFNFRISIFLFWRNPIYISKNVYFRESTYTHHSYLLHQLSLLFLVNLNFLEIRQHFDF